MVLKNKKIVLTGASGFLGRYVYRALIAKGVAKKNITTPSSKIMDLRAWENCELVTKDQDIVIHLAAKIGGIGFNKEKPAEIFYDNLLMGLQLMEAARINGVKKFVTIGTVCAYPKNAPLPFKESDLWDGYPEEVTAPYGIAKKMLLVQGNAYREQYGFESIFLMPVNLYGPEDHFDPKYSHVMAALIKKVVEAKRNNTEFVEVWGTGKATREFLFAGDAADAILLATEKYNKQDPVNLGSSQEISIKDLVALISEVVGYQGEIQWITSQPDGVLRRKVDVSKAEKEFGFRATTSLREGIKKTVAWYEKETKNKK